MVFSETKRALENSYERANQVFAVEEQMLGSDYADKHFFISPEAKGAYTGPWKTRPYQREILNAMCSLEFAEVSWRKAARLGATKMLIAAMTMAVTHYKFNCLTYHPTDKKSDQFVKTEIDPALRDIEFIQKHIRKDSKKDDTLDLKSFSGCLWHFLGGATGEAYRQLSVDWNFNDELSAFERDISDEGDARALSKTRTTESPFQKQINVSSPKITGECLISEALTEMDFEFKYYVPCPECGDMQYMDFNEGEESGVIWDFDMTGSVKRTAKTARYCCVNEECRHESSWSTMMNMTEAGRWMTEDQGYWLENGRVWGFNKKGKPTIQSGERWSIGFDSNIFISEGYSFSQFSEEYIRADKFLKAGRNAKMKTVWNTRLARTWDKDTAIETVDYKLIKPIRYPKHGLIPEEIVAVTSAADCHLHRLEVLTVGWGAGETCYALDYTVLPGEANKNAVWNSLNRYWNNQKYVTQDGRHLSPYLKGIDHGGGGKKGITWLNRVENFCKIHGVRTHLPIKGFLGVDQISAVFPNKPARGVWLVRNNTDTTKSLIYRRFNMMNDPDRDPENTEGFIYFPKPEEDGRYASFDKTFYRSCTSEQREISAAGSVKWVQRGKNEGLDLLSMNHVLITVGQTPVYGIDLDNRDFLTSEEEDEEYDYAEMNVSLHS